MRSIQQRRNMENNWQKELAQAQRQTRREIKRLDKQVDQAEAQLAEALGWENQHHEALLLQSHLYLVKPGMTTVTVHDWNNDNTPKQLHLEPRIPLDEQLKQRFKLAKKLQRSIPHQERRFKQLQNYALTAQERLQKLETIDTEDAWNLFKESLPKPHPLPTKKKEPPPRLPYKCYLSKKGIEIWVGKAAKDNETLTLKLARGNDWWAHTADVPGSHVVIRSDSPDEDTLADAMLLALAHSRLAQTGEGDVILTQRKYIAKGPGGHKPGTVSVSKHKTYRIKLNKERLHQLKAT